MKFRRVVSLVLALMLMLGMMSFANAQTEIVDSYMLEDAYVSLNSMNGMLVVQDKKTGVYTLMTPEGRSVTSKNYIYMNNESAMFEVAVESGISGFGLIDQTGKEMVPMQYGDVIYVSDRWQFGVALTEATSDNYDYKTFDGKSFYLVSAYDVYFEGAKVGTLERTAYRTAYAYGDYLYVCDEENNYTYYDSAFNASSYQSEFAGSGEYNETNDGVFHCGSGQQAFVAGCTLTEDEVETAIYLVDGRFVDLQGNVLFAADAKYESIYNFKGDYAKTRMNGKYGLIDRTGREVLACEYDDISYGDTYFEGGYQIVVKDGKVGFVNKNGETTCEFTYAENAVKSTYKMPLTWLADLEGSAIVLSGAVGELEQHYSEVYLSSKNGCPLFAAEIEQGKAGVVDMYGDVVIPMDGMYDDCYDFQLAADGSVVLAYDTEYNYWVYVLETASGAEEADASVEENNNSDATVEQTGSDESWTCACGNVNTGKFCSECGTERTKELKCPECGNVPEAGTTPKFCSECGAAY